MKQERVRVLFVDDNRLMAEGLERRLGFEKSVQYVGWEMAAENAIKAAEATRADVVVLDVDMPGDSFQVLRDFGRAKGQPRVVMFSGHIRKDYVDRAIDAGAWGYVSKNESMECVVEAIQRVAAGEFVLSPDVEAVCGIKREAS